jgi:hypothetical protein
VAAPPAGANNGLVTPDSAGSELGGHGNGDSGRDGSKDGGAASALFAARESTTQRPTHGGRTATGADGNAATRAQRPTSESGAERPTRGNPAANRPTHENTTQRPTHTDPAASQANRASRASRNGGAATPSDLSTATNPAINPATNPAEPEPELGLGAGRVVDPLVDSGSVGLRMFNLGTIPASVTPPRSWRRAAWFAVGASAAALVGLLLLGALLVGPSHQRSRITALPYFPDGKPLASIGLPTSTDTNASTERNDTESHPDSDDHAADDNTADDNASSINTGDTVGDTVTAPGTPSDVAVNPPANPSAPVALTPPSITTITSSGDPAVDATALMKRTRTFFAEVTTNAAAAANLTSGALHDDAVALIKQKYGDVSTIQIKSISLDPSTGLTVSVLRLVNKDGTTQTQQTTLHFTLTGDPKITNPGG